MINLLLIALDKTLYRFDKREIGCQFLIFVTSPFWGINRIVADLKVKGFSGLSLSRIMKSWSSIKFFKIKSNLFERLISALKSPVRRVGIPLDLNSSK